MKVVATAAICCLASWAVVASAQAPFTSPYYPLEVGTKWTYRATDLKSPEAKGDSKRHVLIEVEREEPYTEKLTGSNGTEVVKKYTGYILKSSSGGKISRDHVVVLPPREVPDGKKTLPAGVHFIHVAETPITPPLLFFKLSDPKPGDTWTCESESAKKPIAGTFKASTEDITLKNVTLRGEFNKMKTLKTYRISFINNKQGEDAIESDTWYAPDIGMIKQLHKAQSHEIMLELEKFEPAKKAK